MLVTPEASSGLLILVRELSKQISLLGTPGVAYTGTFYNACKSPSIG
ncbi:hypothetical protein Pla108_23630 [Botrimarina colliarenosi]|uniref:Uncharacterized protein n=1 Tax=Botrimarina colliarenosi TaxID=2528001 RepID=A0A5C6A9D6_9BACT|nr:hypothetical protein Pla108_23630 [Botrimarina colliarenosi]